MTDPGTDVERHEIADRTPADKVIVHPATGESLNLRLTATDNLARALVEVRDLEDELRTFKRDISDEILVRMDHEATYTVGLPGGSKLRGDGPTTDDYDGAKLYDGLRPLLRAGTIGPVALGKAVKRETTYKAMKRGVAALLKLGNEDVTAAVQAARKPGKTRGVRVEEPARTL